jgi:hypothetical protein
LVSFTSWPLYPQEKNLWHALNRRLDGIEPSPDVVEGKISASANFESIIKAIA